MTWLALILILLAAIGHATWNLLAKRAGGGAVFVWLFGCVSTVVYLPVAVVVVIVDTPHIGAVEVTFIVGSAVLHAAYFLLLQRGYRAGDLSLVYPLARGSGPLLATAGAMAFLAERPTPVALVGVAFVVLGIFGITGLTLKRDRLRSTQLTAVGFGLLTGCLIASYTLWDKYAVSSLLVPALVLAWGSSFGRTLLVSPYAIGHWHDVCAVWHAQKPTAIAVGVLAPLSYLLILIALEFTPVSYVAPAREVSIVVGTVMGSHLLHEADAARRLGASLIVLTGVAILAIG
ncbi:MAG: EamA family transporter [Gammaproteobacteria bacterium]